MSKKLYLEWPMRMQNHNLGLIRLMASLKKQSLYPGMSKEAGWLIPALLAGGLGVPFAVSKYRQRIAEEREQATEQTMRELMAYFTAMHGGRGMLGVDPSGRPPAVT